MSFPEISTKPEMFFSFSKINCISEILVIVYQEIHAYIECHVCGSCCCVQV